MNEVVVCSNPVAVMKLLTDFYDWKYVILLQSFGRLYEVLYFYLIVLYLVEQFLLLCKLLFILGILFWIKISYYLSKANS